MKKLIATLVPVLVLFAGAFTQSSDETFAQGTSNTTTNVNTDVDTNQNQSVSVSAGGDSDSSSKSSSGSNSSIISTSNYKTRTPPITTFPPYLPYWNHGGWGTIKAYFPNGPNNDDQVYERVFDPQNPKMLKKATVYNQERLKEKGDWIIFPLTLLYLAEGRYNQDEHNNIRGK